MPVGKSASGLDEKEKKNSCAVIHFLLLIWIYNIYHNLCSYRQIYKIKALKIHQFFCRSRASEKSSVADPV